MSKMWNEQTSFETMQQQIGDIFQEKLGQGVLIADVLNLERDDYMLLYNRAIRACSPGVFDQYVLLLITAWALAYRYGMREEFARQIKAQAAGLQQHHTKYVMDTFESSFHDYRIDTFGMNIRILDDIGKIIDKHHE